MIDVEDVTHLLFNCCGVYILFDGDTIAYIGKSEDLFTRVSKHKRDNRFNITKVLVHWCEADQLDMMESELINKLMPVHNREKRRPLWTGIRPAIDLNTLGIDLAK